MPDKISLKAARVNANLTLKEACKQIGISESTLIKWEKKPGNVQPKFHKTISEVYKFPIDYIFFADWVKFNFTRKEIAMKNSESIEDERLYLMNIELPSLINRIMKLIAYESEGHKNSMRLVANEVKRIANNEVDSSL